MALGGEGELELDWENFDYEEIVEFGGDRYFVKMACHHRDPEPVLSGGVEVAQLCVHCDQQLPAGFSRR